MHRTDKDVLKREAVTSVQVSEQPIQDRSVRLKRAQDVILASLALFIFAPVMLAIALAVKCESRGPVITRQRSAGFNGAVFDIWRFRSTTSSDLDTPRRTSNDDPSVSRVGRWLRATRFDELPQFLNVLQGHMSVVGPRPHALKTGADGKLLDEMVDKYALRYSVKPGLTGWAQINGFSGDSDSVDRFKRRVKFDLEYIDNWSLALDLRIILRTVARLLVDDPATY